ncbi:bifunctional 5,10-methylenetetrahydrofolate dehydrogenase/5,10-methenyltetrahydrofolate cyclohydrolase [Streptomyces sp. NPDC002018]|uniref:bifunctional 5,10-methylenetetrahydrofolate dehydrogenase/5,10-methenyltetrahydrofolate cyclohydrolase n=1 Tax=Streptomyces sp. NPDC002018 TaxID=3364629 RepID=UPI0036C0DED7
MKLIDGRAVAADIMSEVSAAAAELRAAGTDPTLAIVVPTRDEATAWYVRSIERAAARAGVTSRVEHLAEPDAEDVAELLRKLSADPTVHGIICQTPLPDGVLLEEVAAHIDPRKDVDGASPTSLGRLAAGLPTFAPATAAAVLELLHREKAVLEGARTVVVGRSTVVGKPAALLLLNEHATVTVCHSRTAELTAVCAEADILVVAVGRPHFVGAEHIKPGAVVIDVGTNPTDDGGLAGDVDPVGAQGRAGSLTPVPGGVGPVTTALLLRHTVTAARG